jgi:hypothetical protein
VQASGLSRQLGLAAQALVENPSLSNSVTQNAVSGQLRPPSPCTIVIVGAARELTKRTLVPAL